MSAHDHATSPSSVARPRRALPSSRFLASGWSAVGRGAARLRAFRPSAWDAVVALAIVAYAATLAALSVARHASLQSNTWELGALLQLAANLRAGRFSLPIEPLNPASTIGLHSYGGLALLTLIGWAWSDPRLLLALQATALGLGAWPLYLLARERLGAGVVAAALTGAYLLYPPLHLLNLADFRLASFAVPPLFAAQLALVRGRERRFAAWAAVAAAFQIEALLIVALLALHRAIARRVRWRWLAIALGAAGLVALHSWLLGSLAADVLHGRPWRLLPWAWGSVAPDLGGARLATLGRLLVPLLGLPLLGPLVALPPLALPLLGPPPAGDFRDWYVPLLIPALFVGAVEGVGRASAAADWAGARLGRRMDPALVRRWCAAGLAAGALLCGGSYGLLPTSGAVDPRLFALTAHQARATAILGRIPTGASVSAQNNLLPHLAARTRVSLFPQIGDADYVVLDTTMPWTAALDQRDYVRRVVATLDDPAYGVATIEDGYLLLRRGLPHAPLADTLALLYSRTYTMEEFARPIGREVADPLATGGRGTWAVAPTDGAGYLAANRHLALPPGSYSATFRLAVDWRDPTRDVAAMQVAAGYGARLIAQRQLTGLDFAEAGRYQAFQLIFSVGDDLVEPRVRWNGSVSLHFEALRIAPTSATIENWRTNPPR